MLRMLLSIVISCLVFIGYPANSGCDVSDRGVLEEYVEYFHQNMRPSYTKRAKKLIDPLLGYANQYQVDPLLMACVFSFESSWRNFVGKAGEKGPGQVMPTNGLSWRKIGDEKIDLSTLDGQIKGACAHMRMSLDTCKTIEGVFTHYAGAGCKSSKEKVRKKMGKRVRHYKKMVKLFRGHDDISME